MMDGRIGIIRKTLDKNNFKNTKILSYAVNTLQIFMDHLEMQSDQKSYLKEIKKLIKWTLIILMRLLEKSVWI